MCGKADDNANRGTRLIELTRYNGESFVLNADQIEMVEGAPDTIIRLLSGKKIHVRETVEQVVDLVLGWSRRIHQIAVIAPDEPELEAGADQPPL